MQKHPTHKNASGFTLIELVIAVAIIGILTSVAVLGYNQYKVRAYDAHSKQALRDILLQCNAFWLDHDAAKVCNHATVAEVYVASDEIVLKFPSKDLPDLLAGSHGNFCASAQHESSSNTYSIDSASLISEGDCSPKCFREGCKSSYTVDNPPECTDALVEYHMSRSLAASGRHRSKYEVCAVLREAGICSGWVGGSAVECKAPRTGGEAARALQRR